MSLVSTYVKAVDGNFYKDPVLKGKEKSYPFGDWFLCFDDDDPPELVMEDIDHKLPFRQRAAAIMREMDSQFQDKDLYYQGAGGRRDFGERGFLRAISFFLTIRKPIPVPEKHGGVYANDAPRGMGVYYTFENRKSKR